MSIFDIHKIRNHPDWSTFDRSKRAPFTAKIGELLPTFYKFVNPGDHCEIDLQHFTQTAPFVENAQATIKEHFDVFFVPFRLLYDKSNEILVGLNAPQNADYSSKSNNVIHERLPHTSLYNLVSCAYSMQGGKDPLGFDLQASAKKLLMYLGYGNHYGDAAPPYDWENSAVSVMPLLAYQKIYQDFYRFQSWEKADPYCCNVNYINNSDIVMSSSDILYPGTSAGAPQYGTNMLCKRYVNYNKDYLFGILPNQVNDVYISPAAASFVAPSSPSSSSLNYTSGSSGTFASVGASSNQKITLQNFESNISILQLRAGFALQKFSEIQLFSDENYRDKVKHHFNVDVPNYTAQMAEFIDGTTSVINIDSVVNQNLSDGAEPDRKGIGNNASAKHMSYDVKEHGIIMVMYHAKPLMDYNYGEAIDPQLLCVHRDDFPQPEFDKLGLEPVRSNAFIHDNLPSTVMGYAPRYWVWKTSLDAYMGNFATSRDKFFMKKDLTLIKAWRKLGAPLTYTWFKVDPADCDNLFLPQADDSLDTDVLLVRHAVGFHVRSAMNYSGMPY